MKTKTKITIKIKDCSECPFHFSKRHYTADSFEMAFDYFCAKCENKLIEGYVGWNEKLRAVPDWCPLKEEI